jgi:hypothetical protein
MRRDTDGVITSCQFLLGEVNFFEYNCQTVFVTYDSVESEVLAVRSIS